LDHLYAARENLFRKSIYFCGGNTLSSFAQKSGLFQNPKHNAPFDFRGDFLPSGLSKSLIGQSPCPD